MAEQTTTPSKLGTNPLCVLRTVCQRCGSTDFTDHVLRAHDHAGRSTRRDCARCGWTFGFPLWYGKDREAPR